MCCLEPLSLLAVSRAECGVRDRPASTTSPSSLSTGSTPWNRWSFLRVFLDFACIRRYPYTTYKVGGLLLNLIEVVPSCTHLWFFSLTLCL